MSFLPASTVALWIPALAGLLTGAVASAVSLGLARHAHDLPPRARRRWMATAAVGLATGVWSVALMTPTSADLDGPDPLPLAGVLVGWLLAAGFAAIALMLATRRPLTRLRVLAGGAAFGGAAVVAPLLCQGLPLLATGVGTAALVSIAALAFAGSGAAVAFLLSMHATRDLDIPAPLRRTAAALLMGASWSASAWLLGTLDAPATLTEATDRLSLSPAVATTIATLGTLAFAFAAEALRRMDANARRSLERTRLEMQGHTLRDPLTGLPSRQSFEGTLSQAVQRADADGLRLALLQISLDGMGPVNLTFGHHGGDQVLKEVAKRLRGLGRPHMAARLHSDEFLLLMPDDPDVEGVTALAAEVQQALGRPIAVAGSEASVSCSIGVAVYPRDGGRSLLIAHAGVATRAAKRLGGATHCFFDARLREDSTEQAEILHDLRLALARQQFELVYQPKVHAPSGQITGAEALLRWNHPVRGVISPVVFIPLAERHGLICAIGDWVIEQACRQARLWRDEGLRMRVAVNLSAVQLRQPDLARKIAAVLARHRINPELLTCEITESLALEDTPASHQVFHDLAQAGLHISIDDFGSGFSNLATLRKLPASELKIDRSFVIDLATSEEARKVVRAVVALAKSLDLQVVAEGVETDAQFQVLRELGCDQLQGFLFAKPMTAKALRLWAIEDLGPRSIQFRPSLFKDTAVMHPAGARADAALA